MGFRLVGTVRDRPLRLVLRSGVVVLGSGKYCDLIVEDATISRRHAEVAVDNGNVEIRDLGSTNGTYIGSRKIDGETVVPGTVITFGRVNMTLEQVSEDDLEAGLVITKRPPTAEIEPQRATALQDISTTLHLKPLHAVTLEIMPRLLRKLRDDVDAATMAQAAGGAFFRDLPLVELEVTAADGEAVLFDASDGAGGESVAEISHTSDQCAVRATFRNQATAMVLKPVVETVAALVDLAAAPRVPRVPPKTRPRPKGGEPPPLPEPATVVDRVRELYRRAARVASGDVGVLIRGESGTGKEVMARYLHAASQRADESFVDLNCAALPRDLLEAELFGVEKGAATGVGARPGKFEQADGGTLFLDEIGDLALDTQAKLLRVIEEEEVYRLGANSPRPARARVIAATNKDVDRMMEKGEFRHDLYHRIATWVVELLPLRERRADIPNLTAFFLAHEAAKRGIEVQGVSRAALDVLNRYHWPGNIRQLKQEIARSVLFLDDGDLLDTTCLQAKIVRATGENEGSSATGLASILEEAERRAIERVLDDCEGNISEAAKQLEVHRATLYRRIKALGVQAP